MGNPTSTYDYRRQRAACLTPAPRAGQTAPDQVGIRAADRYRAALFLRRVERRLERHPDQTLDEAFAIEWRTERQIAIAAIACALEAVQRVDNVRAEQADGLVADEPAGSREARRSLRVAARFLRAQAEAQASVTPAPYPYLYHADSGRTRAALVEPARNQTADRGESASPHQPTAPRTLIDQPAPGGETMVGTASTAVAPMQVLVVDDDPDIRRFLRLLLEEEGHHVTAARDGQHALEQIAGSQPDLVLLDLQMPRMNGWELRDELARRNVQVPLVFMTAGDRARAEAERHRVAGYLAKPFSLDDLLGTIERIRNLPTRAS